MNVTRFGSVFILILFVHIHGGVVFPYFFWRGMGSSEIGRPRLMGWKGFGS